MRALWAVALVAALATAGAPAFPARAAPAATVKTAPARPRPRPSPSFDCRTARSGAERIICGDFDLAAKDRRIADLYRRARQSESGPEARDNQRRWLDDRDDCINVQCVRDALDARLLQLEQAGL